MADELKVGKAVHAHNLQDFLDGRFCDCSEVERSGAPRLYVKDVDFGSGTITLDSSERIPDDER